MTKINNGKGGKDKEEKKQIHVKIKQVRKKKSFLKGSLVPKNYLGP